MKNLTSIAEHSEYLSASTYSDSEKWQLHRLRVKFGKQPLEIWQFIPCKLVDGVWILLETPDKKEEWFRDTYDNGWWGDFIKYKNEYQQAKDRCLFEGDFDICSKRNLIRFNNIMQPLEGLGNIENLVKYNLQLTKTAIKQIEP